MNSKEELIQYGLKMKNDCLIKANWGNLSIRVPQGFIISPSGMNYEDISIEDIVTLNLSGEIAEGFRKPSSEYLLHLEIYNKYPNINAVMHTHSTYASAFAVTRKEIPPIIEDMVQIAGGNIRVANYALPGTIQLAVNVVEALEGRNACLLANHGLTGIGRNIEEAYKVCLIVEKSAEIAYISQNLGKPFVLSDEDIKIMREYYLNSYGQK
jgi:L-fuculose-phosphate aldolase